MIIRMKLAIAVSRNGDFDLAGREQKDFELAVAATRKGKSIRNKSGSKKEVKQSKFVARHRIRRTTLVLCSSRSLALPMT